MNYRPDNSNNKRVRVLSITLTIIVLFTVIACSTETRQLFFDIQPPTARELAEQSRKEKVAMGGRNENLAQGFGTFFPHIMNEDLPPPAVEEVMEGEKVEQMLPKDEEDNVDWSQALRQGLIRPKPGDDPQTLLMSIFQWDFIIPAAVDEDEEEDPDEDEIDNEDDAYFPHSAHTQWLSCKNCHMTIYPFRRNPATMKQMKKGQSCGVCHGKRKVAFSLKACDRCHLNSE